MTEEEKKFMEDFQKRIFEEEINSDLDIEKLYSEFGIDMEKLEKDLMESPSQKVQLGYTKIHPDAISPSYNYESDSGFDLYSTEDVTVDGFGRALIPTGLSFDIPEGFEIQVRSKSGLAINQGLMCLNSPGTVDYGYTGEVKVIIFNTNKTPFTITKGMKIAQSVMTRVANGKYVDLNEKNKVANKDRNSNGFGSTGLF